MNESTFFSFAFDGYKYGSVSTVQFEVVVADSMDVFGEQVKDAALTFYTPLFSEFGGWYTMALPLADYIVRCACAVCSFVWFTFEDARLFLPQKMLQSSQRTSMRTTTLMSLKLGPSPSLAQHIQPNFHLCLTIPLCCLTSTSLQANKFLQESSARCGRTSQRLARQAATGLSTQNRNKFEFSTRTSRLAASLIPLSAISGNPIFLSTRLISRSKERPNSIKKVFFSEARGIRALFHRHFSIARLSHNAKITRDLNIRTRSTSIDLHS
jgi:hypothetical protein